MPRVSTVLLAAALILSLLAAALLWRMAGRAERSAAEASVGGPFTLVDQSGHARTDQDFHGRFVLLYFGYTYCPDVCPTTLALMQNALLKLGRDSDRIVPVFITIDPARDSPSALKAYLVSFGPQFVGLTGSGAQIARVAREYHVYYARHPHPGASYSMDHTSTIYFLGPDGRFIKTYDDQLGAAELADDLKRQL